MNSPTLLFRQQAIFVLFILLLIAACKHEPVLPTNPGPMVPIDTSGTAGTGDTKPCDPDSIYFEMDVLPILLSNCAIPTCHDASSRQDGVELTSYDKVIGSDIVDFGDLLDSEIIEVITETDPDKLMPPPPRQKLTGNQIEIISDWLKQGAQDLTCDADTTCDTSAVSYSSSIIPILEDNCVGCHSGSEPRGGVILNTHAGVAAVANSGALYGSITHSGAFEAMPQGASKLSDCIIEQFRLWVEAGAPND